MAFITEDGTVHKDAAALEAATKVEPKKSEPNEPGWFEPGSKSEAALRGFGNSLSLGMAKYAGGALNGLLNGDGVTKGVQSEVAANQASNEAHPGFYGAGAAAGALPMGLAGAGRGLVANSALGAATSGMTTGLDTGDMGEALKSAAIGGALPMLGAGAAKVPGALHSLVGSADAAKSSIGTSITGLAKNGPASGVVKGGRLIDATTGEASTIRPAQLAQQVKTEGPSVLNQPQWADIKSLLQTQHDNGGAMGVTRSVLGEATKGGAVGGGLGAVVGMAPLGGALGAVSGAGKAVKKALTNSAVQKSLSPVAEKGKQVISDALKQAAQKTGGAIGSAGKFATVTGYLNQVSPAARAAMDPDNPGNDKQEE
jgi:hypothetical protein